MDYLLKITRVKFKDIVLTNKGFLRGPFGGDLKKEIFVPKDSTTYKVYEQGVVLQKDDSVGRYYISKEYFDKKMHKFETKTKDFLISCSGANYGAIYQLKKNVEPGVINQALLRIRLNNELIDDDFFYYYFDFYLVNMIIGKKGDSTIPNFPPVSVIKELEFSLIDINTQRKIGTFLKNIDSKIELNNKINKELESMAKTLYDYWFVQFDFPDENGKPYKSSGGKMVYNQELKREIPEGWDDGVLNDLGDIIGGSTPSKKDMSNFNSNGIKWITPKDLSLNSGNKFIAKGEIDVTSKGFSSASLRILPKGSVLLSSRAPIGYIAIASNDLTTNQGFKSFIPYSEYSSSFIYYTLNILMKVIIQNGSGSTFKEISAGTLKDISVFLPNYEIIEKFDLKIMPILNRQELLEKENKKLVGLRDWLLPMLMNGQVKVK